MAPGMSRSISTDFGPSKAGAVAPETGMQASAGDVRIVGGRALEAGSRDRCGRLSHSWSNVLQNMLKLDPQ